MIKKVFSLLFSIMMILSITLNTKVSAKEFNSPCTKEFNWYYSFSKVEGVPHGPKETPYISNHKVVYCGDTSKKEIFLTFDEGYENGNTAKILDILKENQVPAAFFVTRPYIKDYPDLIKRMDEEGHLVITLLIIHLWLKYLIKKNLQRNLLKLKRNTLKLLEKKCLNSLDLQWVNTVNNP